MTRTPSARVARFARAVACGALVFAIVAPVPHAMAAEGAAPLSDYARRLDLASDAARTAAPRELGAKEAAAIAERVTGLLPDGELVRLPDGDGGEVRVDASVLGGLASQLASAKTAKQRDEALERLRGHLDSLRSAMGDDDGGSPGARVRSDPDALRRLVDLRQPRDRSTIGEQLRKLVDRAVTWLSDRIDGLLSPEEGQRLDATVWIVVLVVLSAILLFVGVRALLALRRSIARKDAARAGALEEGMPVVAAAEGLPPDALAYAEELAAAGEYRAAVRALFGGAARALVESGVIGQTRTRTDAELLAEVAPIAPLAHAPLADLTGRFERSWYGHADPGADGFAEAREHYRAVIGAVAA